MSIDNHCWPRGSVWAYLRIWGSVRRSSKCMPIYNMTYKNTILCSTFIFCSTVIFWVPLGWPLQCSVGVLPGRFCRGAEGLVEPPALDAGRHFGTVWWVWIRGETEVHILHIMSASSSYFKLFGAACESWSALLLFWDAFVLPTQFLLNLSRSDQHAISKGPNTMYLFDLFCGSCLLPSFLHILYMCHYTVAKSLKM